MSYQQLALPFHRRVILPPDWERDEPLTAYEEYADGYAVGLRGTHHTAEAEIFKLALGGGYMHHNTPNSTLLGYVHGKAERLDGEPCEAALSYAHKIGRRDHFRGKLEYLVVAKGRAMALEHHDKWVSLAPFLENVAVLSKSTNLSAS